MIKSKKNILIKYLKWLIIGIICVLCAYVAERYGFNSNVDKGVNKKYNMSELEQTGFTYENERLISNQPFTQFVLPTSGYIGKLKIEYAIDDMVAASWATEAQPDLSKADLTNVWLVDCRTNTLIKPIDEYSEQLVITFLDMPCTITIKSISLESNYIFHWQRFLMIATVLFSMVLVVGNGKSIKNHPERTVALVCALMGIAMLSVVPYEKNSWDDETHFANAYRMSYALTGQDTQWVQAADEFINLQIPFTNSYEERLNQEAHMDEVGVIKTGIEERGGIGYYINKADVFPTAVGITLGRICKMDFSDWFVAARLINLLFYTITIYWAVKITPVGKTLLAFLALLPTPLFLTVSYSTDYFMNSLMMLGIAVFLKECLSPEEKLTKKSIAIFILSMFFACIRKTIYIPIILIGLILPKSKFVSKKDRNIYRGIIVGCCVLLMLAVVFTASGMTDVRGGDTSVSEQISYIISNPLSFAVMFIKEIVRYSIDYIFNGEGKINFNISGMRSGTTELVTVISLVVLVLFTRDSDKKREIPLKTSVIGLGLLGLVICFIWGSMYLSYTPVGSNMVAGVQARHYIPFLFLLFILLPLNKVKCYISEKIIMQGTLVMVVLINVVSMYGLLLKP